VATLPIEGLAGRNPAVNAASSAGRWMSRSGWLTPSAP
jgi:hypothetical protein